MQGLPAERVVAFVDLLAFTDLLRRITKGEQALLSTILTALDVVEETGRAAGGDITVTAFSDSIVASTHPADAGALIDAIAVLSRRLLLGGILCRGGVASGWTYHNGGRVFGQGLLQAYMLENRLAVYPRVIIGDIPDIWILSRRVERLVEGPVPIRRVTEDFDGGIYIDLFNCYFATLGPTLAEIHAQTDEEDRFFIAGLYAGHMDHMSDHEIYLAAVRPVICKGLLLAADDPGKLAKWHWLRHRFNDQLDGLRLRYADRPRLVPIEWPPRPNSTGFGWPEDVHVNFRPSRPRSG